MRFGWTPHQVDELPAWYAVRIADYVDLWDQVTAERRNQK